MGGILSLEPPGIENRIHPRAMAHFRKFLADVRFEVPLEELNNDDLDRYLKDHEKPEFQRYMTQITDGLGTCIDIGDEDSGDNQTKLLLFEINTTIPMYFIKPLLRKVYDRKMEKVREELKKKQEEKRRAAEEAREKQRQEEEQQRQQAAEAEEKKLWHTAYQALDVPAGHAEKYLTEPGEYEKFIKSIAGAVRAYMDKGESYTDDSRANDYLFYCNEINRGKDKEQRKLAAVASARLFSYSLNEKIKKLKASLHLQKQSPTKYFGKDIRYIGQRFYELLSTNEREDLFDTVQAMVKEELGGLVSGELSDFIDWKHTQYYRLLPTVDYVLDDIPCLNFSFDTEIVVEVEIWLKPGEKTFGGYVFDLPVIEGKNYSVKLQEPEFLGYYYMHFAASDLPSTFWQRIPLLLVISLTDDEIEPPGVTILEASENAVIYRIRNFEKEVIIPAIFIDFLKAVGGIEGMVSMGIMTQEVADIVQQKLTEVGTAPMKEASENRQPGSYSNEEYISKMASLYYPRKDSEILLQSIPRDLSLDEAVKWSLKHYGEIIPQNPTRE